MATKNHRGHTGAASTGPTGISDALETRVVSILRDIHDRRKRGQPWSWNLAAPADAGDDPVPDPAADGAAEPTPDPDLYERARRFFADQEKFLTGQSQLTDRIIDQIRRGVGPPAPAHAPSHTQELLRLRARRGGVAGGRFVVANRDPRPVRVTLEASPLQRFGEPLACQPAMRLDPAAPVLEAGDETVVSVYVDLGDLDLPSGETLGFEVTAHHDPGGTHRLWVEIELYELPDA